jgi:type II secretory pathway pseudopilin PulG
MELVLVMVIIAVLAGGMIFGFTTYVNKAKETVITKDYSTPLKNPVRVTAIESGRLPTPEDLLDMYMSDGFNNTGGVGTIASAPDGGKVKLSGGQTLLDMADLGTSYFDITNGSKEYTVVVDVDNDTTEMITIFANHSRENTAVRYELNQLMNDVVTTNGRIMKYVPDGDTSECVGFNEEES